MYGYIYKTTNLVNGKIYIGQHKSDDFDPDYYGSGKILKKAIKKYGIENFSVSVLTYCNSKSEMDSLERQLIKIYDSRNPSIGYNIAYGGEGGDSVTCLPDEDYKRFVAMMSDMNRKGITGNKGKHLSEKHKQRIGDSNRGKIRSDECKMQMSKIRKGTPAWNKGLTVDTDDRVKQYARKKGTYHHSDETRLKISSNMINRGNIGKYKKSDAHKQKLSDAIKGKIWINNGEMSKMIYPYELDEFTSQGYKLGRLYIRRKNLYEIISR